VIFYIGFHAGWIDLNPYAAYGGRCERDEQGHRVCFIPMPKQ
jgi:hypothetical protein